MGPTTSLDIMQKRKSLAFAANQTLTLHSAHALVVIHVHSALATPSRDLFNSVSPTNMEDIFCLVTASLFPQFEFLHQITKLGTNFSLRN
jgi:hypothetical protein